MENAVFLSLSPSSFSTLNLQEHWIQLVHLVKWGWRRLPSFWLAEGTVLLLVWRTGQFLLISSEATRFRLIGHWLASPPPAFSLFSDSLIPESLVLVCFCFVTSKGLRPGFVYWGLTLGKEIKLWTEAVYTWLKRKRQFMWYVCFWECSAFCARVTAQSQLTSFILPSLQQLILLIGCCSSLFL